MNSFFKNGSGQLFYLFIQMVVTHAVLVYSFFCTNQMQDAKYSVNIKNITPTSLGKNTCIPSLVSTLCL